MIGSEENSKGTLFVSILTQKYTSFHWEAHQHNVTSVNEVLAWFPTFFLF